MSRTHDQIPPPESAIPAAARPGNTRPVGACGTVLRDTHFTVNRALEPLVSVDLAAEAAALEAGQVSALLASGMLSLTNLQPDALPRLLHRS